MPPKTYRSLHVKQPSSMKAVARVRGTERRVNTISRSTGFSSEGWSGKVEPIDRTKLVPRVPGNGSGNGRTKSRCAVQGRSVTLVDCLEINGETTLTFTCPTYFEGEIPLERCKNILTIRNPLIIIGLPENTGELITAEYNNGICVMRFGQNR